ncbi:COX15/CtaA family protein, partial [Roseomonas mucosa]
RALRRLAHATAGLAGLTMLAGGFVAGIKAGFDYNTFPLMAGQWVPDGYLFLSPAWRNLFENVASVQFNHRLLATLTGLLAIGTAWYGLSVLPRGTAGARRARWWVGALALATIAQYALGVAALVNVVPAWLGTLHQAMAVGVLTAALGTLHALRRPRGGAGAPRDGRAPVAGQPSAGQPLAGQAM